MYVDFHTHLDCYKDQEDLLRQLSLFNGLIVTAAMDAASYTRNLEIQSRAKAAGCAATIIPTFGIHPALAAQAPDDLSVYDHLCSKSPIIGEIGMDFCWYKDASPDRQERVFRYFLDHCNKTGKYCVIHTKDAEREICRILEDYPRARPVIHWYDGPTDIFQEFIARGYMTTFGCQTSRSFHIQELLKITPERQLLAETDNPDSKPWLGGSDNSVGLIRRVYSDIAKVRGVSLEQITAILDGNTAKMLQ